MSLGAGILARLFVIVGSLIVLVLTTALIGPYFIDWTNYRAQFEAEASKILGRQVTVEGDASARLLPFPSVTFSDVHVAGTRPGETAMTAETFSMDAELAPLMSGEFRIFDMRLVRPHLRVAVDQNGTIDWAVPSSTPFDPHQISVEALTITDGKIDLVHGPSGLTHSVTDLDASLSARTLAGPWRMDGTMKLDGLPSTLSISTGAVDETGGMRLRIAGGPDAYPIAVDLDGTLRFADRKPNYAGALRLTASNAMPPKPREGEPAAPPPVPDYRVSGAFDLSSERLALNEARFETGPIESPYTADGTAEISFGAAPRFVIRADGAQVRFDETVAGADAKGVTLEQRLTALERVVSALPRPTIPGTVEVNLPAVVAGDTTIRDVRLSAQPAPQGWQLDTFAASLPGRTRLEGSGLLRAGDDFGFSGRLLLAVAQPSGFAAWLSRDVDEAIRVLPAAGFDATVETSRGRQELRDLELQLGDARFKGEIARAQTGNARPSMNVKLDGDALDVEGLAAFASIFVSDEGQTRLADHDLDFQIKAGPVRASGLVAETLDTALRLRGERLEIDRLAIGGLAGTSISATGSVDNLGGVPTGDIDASLVATDLAPLINQLAGRYPAITALQALNDRAVAYPGLFADTQIDVVASAASAEGSEAQPRGLALSARGTSGGTSLQLTASTADLSRPLPDMAMTISLDAANDDGAALLALSGVTALPLGLLDRAEASLSLDGSLGNGLRTAFALRGEDIDAGFDGSVSFGEAEPRAQGEARLSAGDIEPWLMTAGLGMPGMGFGTPVGLAGSLSLEAGKLTTSVEGSWNHDDVEGNVTAELRNSRPHITGNLSVGDVDLAQAAAMLLGGDSVATTVDRSWPQTPFATTSTLPLTLDMRLATGELEVGAGVLFTNAAMNLKLDDEGLRISDLAANYAGGRLSGLASLQNSVGSALFSAQLALNDADIPALTGQSALSGRGDFGVTVSGSGKSVDGVVAALSGSGTAKLRDVTIEGLNPNALPALIAQADTIGRTVDDKAVQAFAPAILGQGRMQAGNADVAFSIANGTLRMPLTQFAAEEATLSTELALDAGQNTLNGRATVAYEAGDNALAGSEPTVALNIGGSLEEPEVSYDTTALAQFLTQRALEIEQARVEAMQAQLLEQQRLRREVRYYEALQTAREEAAEAERVRQEDERRRAAEAAQQEAERAEQAAAEAARRETERAEEAARAREERRTQPEPQNSVSTPRTPPTDFPAPFQMPTEIPDAQGLQPLQPPSAPGAGGTLPGVFENQPGG
ncbi:AsmA family protein [Tianweitania sp. BSSL-BM11]|uniref:AsmA family protein n=1 Tax=Tianweitania aestuarii TaxID=2814886 RepID=A0ABS5RX55_9HYPH|nr:AsmA family protein [Tianweitania aestuarii]MBS9720887.1 AsmA family protein [Tianweitania aestuarii]